MPHFVPPAWDKDKEGNKINRFRSEEMHNPTLNKLTVQKFESLCKELNYRFIKREYVPIQPLRRWGKIGDLAKMSAFREFLTAWVTYEIEV